MILLVGFPEQTLPDGVDDLYSWLLAASGFSLIPSPKGSPPYLTLVDRVVDFKWRHKSSY